MDIAHTITIDAPAERVWELTVDLGSLPRITPTVTSVDLLDEQPVAVGTRARLKQPGLPPRVWRVEELDAPHRFVWTTRLLGVHMAGVHELATLGAERCQLTLRVLFDGRGSGLVGRLSRRSIARAIAQEAAGFARAATSAST